MNLGQRLKRNQALGRASVFPYFAGRLGNKRSAFGRNTIFLYYHPIRDCRLRMRHVLNEARALADAILCRRHYPYITCFNSSESDSWPRPFFLLIMHCVPHSVAFYSPHVASFVPQLSTVANPSPYIPVHSIPRANP